MKGYKAFNKDLTCRNMQYEIGKEYTFDGKPIPCVQGFHFCKSIADCYKFYAMSEDIRICEIIASGDIKTDDEIKYCTNKIKIIREIKNPRVKSNTSPSSSGYCNTGNHNTGNYNTGNWNLGDYNTGDQNTGDYNFGYRNSGDYNTGDYNTGDYNTGDYNFGRRNSGDHNTGLYNTGNWNLGNWNSGERNLGRFNTGEQNFGSRNSGDRNSGDWNSGDWNSGYYNSGIFNTIKNPKIKIFDKESDWTMADWLESNARYVMLQCPFSHTEFIFSDTMTDEEKEEHPEFKTICGYMKRIVVTNEDKQRWWDSLPLNKRRAVYELPNFDAEKFKMCTGITVKEREVKNESS